MSEFNAEAAAKGWLNEHRNERWVKNTGWIDLAAAFEKYYQMGLVARCGNDDCDRCDALYERYQETLNRRDAEHQAQLDARDEDFARRVLEAAEELLMELCDVVSIHCHESPTYLLSTRTRTYLIAQARHNLRKRRNATR